MLHPAAAAGAAAALPRLLLPVPLPRRSSTTKEHPHRVQCTDQFRWKLSLSAAARSHRSRGLFCSITSGSSAELAALSRPTDASSAHGDQSFTCCMESVPGTPVVISGYWTGPDVDDGCGSVEAVLQRIVWYCDCGETS